MEDGWFSDGKIARWSRRWEEGNGKEEVEEQQGTVEAERKNGELQKRNQVSSFFYLKSTYTNCNEN